MVIHNQVQAQDTWTFAPQESLRVSRANHDSWLSASDNGETLLAKMNTREYYGEDSREDMLNCLGRLTYQLKRSKGENSIQLNLEEVKLLMNYTKGSLHVTDVKDWLRFHETELDFRVGSKDPRRQESRLPDRGR